jgi:hypothetical protein
MRATREVTSSNGTVFEVWNVLGEEASMSSAIDDEIEGIYNVPGVNFVYCREV